MRGGRGRLLRKTLLPFKAYIIGASAAVVGATLVAPEALGAAATGEGVLLWILMGGYGLSSIGLLVGALVAAVHVRDRRMAWSALGFAGAGLLLAAMLWAGVSPPLIKWR